MKKVYSILFSICLFSCSNHEKNSNFFENCNDSMLKLENGIEVTDSLNYFSYSIPDSSWHPERFLDEKENGLTVGDTSEGYMKLFNVNQSDYTYDWNWDEEFKNVEKDFNVIEKGEILFQGILRPYHIVLFEEESPEFYSFYLTYLDTIQKRQFTLNITVEGSSDYKARICNMRPILESFKIKN